MEQNLSARRRALALFVLTAFLILFRARWAVRLINRFDDACYSEWLHKMIGVAYPACYSRSHLPGIALLWLPAGWTARTIAAVTGQPLDAWLNPLVGLSTFACWVISLFLIDRLIRDTKQTSSTWLPIALLCTVPVLGYTMRLNFSTHGGELLMALLTVWFATRRQIWFALASALVLGAIRLNDLPTLLLVCGAYWDRNRERTITLSAGWRRAFVAATVGAGAIAAFFVYRIGFVKGYNGVFLPQILRHFSLSYLWPVLTDGNDGLFWTAGWWLLCLALGFVYLRRLTWTARAAWVWMALHMALLVALMRLLPNDLGFPQLRYTIGTYAGAFLVWLEVWPYLSRGARRLGNAVLAVYAIWTPFLMYTFDGVTISNSLHLAFRWLPRDHVLARIEFLRYPGALLKLLGMSPAGWIVYSWRTDFPLFVEYRKYALVGPELWIMTVLTVAAIAGAGTLVYRRVKGDSASPAPTGTSEAEIFIYGKSAPSQSR